MRAPRLQALALLFITDYFNKVKDYIKIIDMDVFILSATPAWRARLPARSAPAPAPTGPADYPNRALRPAASPCRARRCHRSAERHRPTGAQAEPAPAAAR